jgi:cell division protein FtsL
MIKRIFFYLLILTFPAFLGLIIWQSVRYADLERELLRLEKAQEEWVENNKRLIANITVLSAPDRIERIARDELGLQKKRPEEVLQISIGSAANNVEADSGGAGDD